MKDDLFAQALAPTDFCEKVKRIVQLYLDALAARGNNRRGPKSRDSHHFSREFVFNPKEILRAKSGDCPAFWSRL
jgi:hypothetical protein